MNSLLWFDDSYYTDLHKTSRVEMIKVLSSFFERSTLYLLSKNVPLKPLPEVNVRLIYNKYRISTRGNAYLTFFEVLNDAKKFDKVVVVCSPYYVFPCLLHKFLNRQGKVIYVMDIRSIPVEINGKNRKIKEAIFWLSVWLGIKFLDGVSFINLATQSYIESKLKIKKKYKYTIWTSGVDPKLFNCNYDQNRNNLRKKLGILDDEKVLIYHGAISPNRGLDSVIDAIYLIKNNKGIPLKLLIIGNGTYKQKLVEKVNKLGLSRHIIILPPVPHDLIPSYICAADFGVIPLPKLVWWELSSPLKLLEYLSCGKPVIASPIRPHVEVVNECKCGFLLSFDDPSHLAEGLSKIIKIKNSIIKEMGFKGRKFVKENYSWKSIGSHFFKFLISI